jgi:hypothetical protein
MTCKHNADHITTFCRDAFCGYSNKDELERLKAENARYREALEIYADEKNWSESDTLSPYDNYVAMTDCGDIAREALKNGE